MWRDSFDFTHQFSFLATELAAYHEFLMVMTPFQDLFLDHILDHDEKYDDISRNAVVYVYTYKVLWFVFRQNNVTCMSYFGLGSSLLWSFAATAAAAHIL